MSNTLAVYKNQEILDTVSKWFSQTYGIIAEKEDGFYTIHDLYQSYHEFTMPARYTYQRLNINEFAKCIVACKILDIGGIFRLVPESEPAPSAITRATA